MTCQLTSTGRTFSTSTIHRDVIQAHGHNGSNQKSAVSVEAEGSRSDWASLISFANRRVSRYLPDRRPRLALENRRGIG